MSENIAQPPRAGGDEASLEAEIVKWEQIAQRQQSLLETVGYFLAAGDFSPERVAELKRLVDQQLAEADGGATFTVSA